MGHSLHLTEGKNIFPSVLEVLHEGTRGSLSKACVLKRGVAGLHYRIQERSKLPRNPIVYLILFKCADTLRLLLLASNLSFHPRGETSLLDLGLRSEIEFTIHE